VAKSSAVREEEGGLRREENMEKHFLGLEVDELILAREKADLAADTVEVKSERRWR